MAGRRGRGRGNGQNATNDNRRNTPGTELANPAGQGGSGSNYSNHRTVPGGGMATQSTRAGNGISNGNANNQRAGPGAGMATQWTQVGNRTNNNQRTGPGTGMATQSTQVGNRTNNNQRTGPGAGMATQSTQAGNRTNNNQRTGPGGAMATQSTAAGNRSVNNQRIGPGAGVASSANYNQSNLAFLSGQPGNVWLNAPATPPGPIIPSMAPRMRQQPLTPAASPVLATAKPVVQRYLREQSFPPTPPSSPPRNEPPRPNCVGARYPWEFDIGYPKPNPRDGKGWLAYQWDDNWVSHNGKEAISEWQKEVAAKHFLSLPIPTGDMGLKRRREVETRYNSMGQYDLYNLRMKHMEEGNWFDSTLVFTSNIPSVQKPGTWSPHNRSVEPVVTPLQRALAKMTNPNLLQCVVSTDKAEYCPRPNLFNLLAMPEIGEAIIGCLKPSLRDLSALGMACKGTLQFMRQHIEVWDFTSQNFPTDRFETITEIKEVNGEQRDVVIQGGGIRSHTLVITGAGNDSRATDHPYAESFDRMVALLAAVRKVPSSFRDLVLHQLPFLDHRVLNVMINSMPNLKTLSISGCLLLDASKLPSIIQVIRENPRRHTDKDGNTIETYIKVDFSPFRFFGPQCEDRLGSFLITHHKPAFDIPKAVTALILRCLGDADQIGMDLLSDGSSFWHFFRQLPGPCALWAVKVRETIERMRVNQRDKAAAKKGGKTVLKYDEMAILDNLCAAVSGDYRAPGMIPKTRAIQHFGPNSMAQTMWNFYWRERWTCPGCNHTFPASLFVHVMPKAAPICWACSYQEFAKDVDNSHFRYRMLEILDSIFDGFKSRMATVHDVLMSEDHLQFKWSLRQMADEEKKEKLIKWKKAMNEKNVDEKKAEKEKWKSQKAAEKAEEDANKTPQEKAAEEAAQAKRTPEQRAADEKAAKEAEEAEEKAFERLYRQKLADGFLKDPVYNYSMASSLAQMTDKAWNYYRNLPAPVPPDEKGFEGPTYGVYGELDAGCSNKQAGAIYRWSRLSNKLNGRTDYRQGGPQHLHPYFAPTPPIPADPKNRTRPPMLSKDVFKLVWKAGRRFYNPLRMQHAEDYVEGETDLPQFRSWLVANQEKLKLGQRERYFRGKDQRVQTNNDYDCRLYGTGRARDCMFSLSTDGKAVYNLDQDQFKKDSASDEWGLLRYDDNKPK